MTEVLIAELPSLVVPFGDSAGLLVELVCKRREKGGEELSRQK